MFNKPTQEKGFKEVETIIGPSVKVKGDFNGLGNVIVEGIVEGSLKTNGSLRIGDKAKVTASIEAKEAKIGGEVKGNVKIKGYLDITATAKIFGDLEAASLSIERGAMLNGKCTMAASSEESRKTSKLAAD
ncbi:cell shape determination protein CcmA [Candidatus Falkowbacteria bacterium CG_4_9_14_3_um_filter_38_19]|uniref:Cell shape determination protein CcmA n=1 Tax=Candidatus Falkowbacteria bacterium CG_4_9_14_3_um_filter_38_19 TaxID=1974559 RepID=A0A2M8AET8_9BACT|nr:MAG: cell shape determination protein CcmA [Candidatus Falkowbacteria bacterium CG_4_9_14_3_um_filter_38_19]